MRSRSSPCLVGTKYGCSCWTRGRRFPLEENIHMHLSSRPHPQQLCTVLFRFSQFFWNAVTAVSLGRQLGYDYDDHNDGAAKHRRSRSQPSAPASIAPPMVHHGALGGIQNIIHNIEGQIYEQQTTSDKQHRCGCGRWRLCEITPHAVPRS